MSFCFFVYKKNFVNVSHAGLSVVYMSGRHSLDAQPFGTYSQDDVDVLRALADESGVVDLFLTYPCLCISCSIALKLTA